MAQVMFETPFDGVDDLPRVLRTAACTTDAVKLTISSKNALVLARRIEAAGKAEEAALRYVTVEVPQPLPKRRVALVAALGAYIVWGVVTDDLSRLVQAVLGALW